MKTISRLIKERKGWLGDNGIEHWTGKDTEFVAKEYASQAIDQLIYTDEQILKMESKIQSVAVISNMRANKVKSELK